MKKSIYAVVAAMAMVGFIACNDSASDTSTDTTTNSGTTSEVSGTSTNDMESYPDPDPAASYVDLKSGKSVKLRRDTTSRYIVDETSSSPVSFYVNPSTNDTFDRSGRVVNNALVNSNGDWTVDESRIKVKTQSDGDLKMKDRETDTKVKVETDGDGKIKTDSSKIKMKDGEIKVKKN